MGLAELSLAFFLGVLVSGVLVAVGLKITARHQKDHFQILANEILQKNSQQYLKPFDEKLEQYYQFIHESQKNEGKERQAVKEQIDFMLKSAQRIELETSQLTRALSSDVKFQGDWGEMVLQKVLELAGLRENAEFFLQQQHSRDGQSYRPDVIVKLPHDAHLIIDSKVSLKAYFEVLNESGDKALADLKQSIKNHIDQLAKKDYQHLDLINAPEFVYLFIPVEGVYSLLLKEFPELIEHALRKNIVLVSPINLMANLKTVGALWRVDKQSKSAVEIAHKAGAMYDKFVLLIKDIEQLQAQFKKVDHSLVEINKKLHQGRGNLVDRAQELKEQGARTSKEL